MATRDIYETGFDEDVQTNSSTNQCPECDGHVTTNIKETVCEDCGLVIQEQRLDHGPVWRGYDEDERERTGAPLTAARHDRSHFDRDRAWNRCERERTLRTEAPAAGPDAT
jgi:transcription initiation factor TFIIB